ncbi:MAG: ComF family protein [Pseudomonadota bacterium]
MAEDRQPAIARLRDALFPPQCPSCAAETGSAGGLCPACFADAPFLSGAACSRCARPEPGLAEADPDFICTACLAEPPPWRRAAAVGIYGGTLRRMILGLKRADRLDTVPLLAGWLARAAAPLLAEAEVILPVPLHWRRRVARRYNQSAELARALAGLTEGAEYAPQLLRRVRATPSQEGRNREERFANLDRAFAPARGAAARIAGRRILLVDDVLTTGATLGSAAKALQSAGAGQIDVAVIALAGSGDGAYLGDLTNSRDEGEAAS